jgi:hypothetical protein
MIIRTEIGHRRHADDQGAVARRILSNGLSDGFVKYAFEEMVANSPRLYLAAPFFFYSVTAAGAMSRSAMVGALPSEFILSG